MTGPEKGFLLLTSHLGDPNRRVLSTAQLRTLSQRVRRQEPDREDRQLREEDLIAFGYGREMAKRMVKLLSEEELLYYYLQKGETAACRVLTWASDDYPRVLRNRLGEETPGCLWYKGDLSLLTQPKVALVGSRDLLKRNALFAQEVGKQAARQGYVLVSGNAKGADMTAQCACLEAGGRVISVVADRLTDKTAHERILYLSEDDFDSEFSAQRAISRNRVIHALAEKTFVAQCGPQKGGTWDGTVKNLRYGWSPVYAFRDDSDAFLQLQQMGAFAIDLQQLEDFQLLPRQEAGLFEE